MKENRVKEEKRIREEKKRREDKKKPIFGPAPPCKAIDCPLRDFPHSKGIYIHDGKPANNIQKTPTFGKSNPPPPSMKRTGTTKQIQEFYSLPSTSPMTEGKAAGGSPWTNDLYWNSKYVEKTVEVLDRKQEGFLKYHRGCTCEKCKCSNLGGCNCFWKGACTGTVRFE